MPREYMKSTRAGRICRVGNGSPAGYIKEERGVLYVDIGSGAFKAKRNSHAGPFITLDSGSPSGVRTEREGTFYLDIASNTIGAVHRLYVNTDGGTTWASLSGKVYININGSVNGWVAIT